MKKFLVFLVAVSFGLASASAMTESELKEKLNQSYTVNKSTFKTTDEEKELIARYLDQYEVTSNDADVIWAKLQAVFDVLKKSGKKTFQELSSADKARVVALVGEVDATDSIDCAIVDSRFIVYVPNTNKGKIFYKTPVTPIAQTNRDLIVAGLGIISVLGMALAFKKIKNA